MFSRKIVLATLGLAFGIAMASVADGIKIAILAVLVCVCLLACFYVAKHKTKILLVFVSILLGFCVFSANYFVFSKGNVNMQMVEVVGIATDDTYVLRDCVVDGNKVDGKISLEVLSLEVQDNHKIVAGSKIKFVCILRDCFIDKDGMYTAYYKAGIRYFTNEIYGTVVLLNNTTPHFDETARLYIKDMLSNYLNDEVFGVAYAMVVGDTRHIDANLLEDFREVGIAHIFAVSGLHVGFVVMLINMFVKKRKKLAFVLTMSVVLVYAYICNFAPSIMRAMTMTFILLFTKALGREPDFLASVSTAAFVILLAKPFYLFDAGFLMSVGAVLGIDFATRSIERKIKNKKKWQQKIISSFAISFGATLGTLPFMLQYFGKVAIIGLVANVIIVPVISIVFMSLLMCLICPVLFMGFPVIGLVLSGIIKTTNIFALIEPLHLPAINFAIATYFVLLYILSGHSNYKTGARVAMCVMSVVFIASMVANLFLPKEESIVRVYDTDGTTICVQAGKNYYTFSSVQTFADSYYVNMLAQECYDSHFVLYLMEFEEANASSLVALAQNLKTVGKSMEIRSLADIDVRSQNYKLIENAKIKLSRVKQEDNGNFAFVTYRYGTKTVATHFCIDDKSFAYVPYLTDEQKQYVLSLAQANAYFSINAFYDLKEAYEDSIVVTKDHCWHDDVYTQYRYGTFSLKIANNKIFFKND